MTENDKKGVKHDRSKAYGIEKCFTKWQDNISSYCIFM